MEEGWNGRPDLELLLGQNFPDNNNKGRGKLRIFLGYAASVGKTFAVPEAACQEEAGRRGVVVGYVEPHDRPDILALLDGLELLTPKYVEHKGITLQELGPDGVLIQRPDPVLVDELARINAQGCRHKERCQDMTELLDAGINVYTTVNVRHLESLHDVMAPTTHIQVNEHMPGRAFDNTVQAELVDIGPGELRQRLEEGKIYHREQADRASVSFFTAQDLSALREIALRRTAGQVNRGVIGERDTTGKDYFAEEHMLVCPLSSSTNAKVVRAAARMTSAFHADLTAVLVETGHLEKEHVGIGRSMEASINLTKQSKANVITLYGDDIVEQMASYARQDGVSKVVIGRTVRMRHNIFARPTLIDRLVKMVPGTDIYVVPDTPARECKRNGGTEQKCRVGSDLLKAALVMAFCTAMSLILDHYQLGIINAVMTYMMGTILSAYPTRVEWCSFLASVVSMLLFNFFFTEPRCTPQADAPIYPFTSAAMLVCTLVTSFVAPRLKREAVKGETESRYMQILFDISRNLRKSSTGEKISGICGTLVRNLLKRNIVIYDTREDRTDRMKMYSASESEGSTRLTSLFKQQSEAAVAFWAYKNRYRAGATADTLLGAQVRYTPAYKGDRVYTVIGTEMRGGGTIQPSDRSVLNIIAGETSYRLGDMKEGCPRQTKGTRPCRPGIVFALDLCDVPSDAWNLYDHMQCS